MKEYLCYPPEKFVIAIAAHSPHSFRSISLRNMFIETCCNIHRSNNGPRKQIYCHHIFQRTFLTYFPSLL